MTPEQLKSPAPKRPYEIYGFREPELLKWRVSHERLQEILDDEQTVVHAIKPSSNDYGEFLFVTTSRPGERERIAMTFYGLGYHEHRDRWLTDEWFWYQANALPNMMGKVIDKEEAKEMLRQRLEEISPEASQHTQSERGKAFDMLADLTDDDGALAEMEDLESLDDWIFDIDQLVPFEEPPDTFFDETPAEPPPTGENLLDQASREKLPPLYSGEEQGLDALALVKFFTPDAQWTWYASEFDGDDIFFGLVSGMEVELGYFSLKELKEAVGPMGLQIERDLHFEPKKLGELLEWHRQHHNGSQYQSNLV
ncbi:MAG: DUF2958 domain-containing protein [Anaerolineales bacterium]|nr:DUF2958 domain-containing protein [Anaerolineales bacterium]